jgi:hypothetical protein
MPHQDTTAAAPRTAADFARELENFNGSLTQYRSPFGMLYTEGVRHLLKESEGVVGASGQRCGGAYWLLDAIASHQPQARKACDGFQLWTLTLRDQGAHLGATLTCREDSDQEPVITQEIEHTDFPLPSVKLYVIDNVALLPDEY